MRTAAYVPFCTALLVGVWALAVGAAPDDAAPADLPVADGDSERSLIERLNETLEVDGDPGDDAGVAQDGAAGPANGLQPPSPEGAVDASQAPEQHDQKVSHAASTARPAVGYVPEDALQRARAMRSAQAVIAQIDALAATGAQEQAVKRAREALASDPGHRSVRLRLARILLEAGGDPAEALEVLEPLLSEQHADPDTRFWAGTAALLSGRLEQAAAELDAALNERPQDPDLWTQRAVVALEQGRVRFAVTLLRTALDLDPQHPLALVNAGWAFERLEDTAAALSAYRRFLTTPARPHGPDAAMRRAIVQRVEMLSANEPVQNAQRIPRSHAP